MAWNYLFTSTLGGLRVYFSQVTSPTTSDFRFGGVTDLRRLKGACVPNFDISIHFSYLNRFAPKFVWLLSARCNLVCKVSDWNFQDIGIVPGWNFQLIILTFSGALKHAVLALCTACDCCLGYLSCNLVVVWFGFCASQVNSWDCPQNVLSRLKWEVKLCYTIPSHVHVAVCCS